jgi:prophage regulatory protein
MKNAPTFYDLADNAYLRQSQLIPDILPFSPATLWRKTKRKEFPQPVRLSEKITAWRVGDVRAWIQSRNTPNE